MSSADELLADAWSACELGRSITHGEHVRTALYDGVLTRRWSEALADALGETGARDADELIRARPELLRSDLFGPPAWKSSGAPQSADNGEPGSG